MIYFLYRTNKINISYRNVDYFCRWYRIFITDY